VLSGVTGPEVASESATRPHHTIDSIADLNGLMSAETHDVEG
jgi:hypothetical protein